MLSGKYHNNKAPAVARLNLFKDYFPCYVGVRELAAVEAYCPLAEAHGLSKAQMALAFVNQRPFLSSNIIGATNFTQLAENIASADLLLSDDLLRALMSFIKTIPIRPLYLPR